MAYRWHPKNAEVDPESPRSWGACDRCGFIYNTWKLRWQYDYNGSIMLQNLRILVCEKCYDDPQPQLAPVILSPDPVPVFNARQGAVDIYGETSWMFIDEDNDILATQDGESFITAIPNPNSTENTQDQASVNIVTEDGAEIVTESGDGNPLDYEPNP